MVGFERNLVTAGIIDRTAQSLDSPYRRRHSTVSRYLTSADAAKSHRFPRSWSIFEGSCCYTRRSCSFGRVRRQYNHHLSIWWNFTTTMMHTSKITTADNPTSGHRGQHCFYANRGVFFMLEALYFRHRHPSEPLLERQQLKTRHENFKGMPSHRI